MLRGFWACKLFQNKVLLLKIKKPLFRMLQGQIPKFKIENFETLF